jgi:hypothetical protein
VIRTCTGCGNLFDTMDLRKKRCRKNCGRTDANSARADRRENHILTFTGIDGEGINRPDGTHIYDMLSVGNNTLTSPDGSQLQWSAIFSFLWENYCDNPTDVYAGFFLGYDFTQWFRTMPEDRAAMLLSPAGRMARRRTAPGTEHLGPFPVRADGWEFDILGMKRFKLRYNPDGLKKDAPGWMYINDAGSYFQQSFLAVIDPSGWDQPVCSDTEFATVLAGKSDRGVRRTLADQLDHRAETARYNTLENDILGRVLTRLNTGFTAAGVQLNRRQWYGPGQAAQTWMGRIEAPTAVQVQEAVPRSVLEAARDSYYGGWFEILRHGHIPGQSHEYDINSAYPHAIAQLPCLLHGQWVRDHTDSPWTLVQATVEGSDTYCGAMPHREKDGRVLRPHKTSGWHWASELLAADRAGLISSIRTRKRFTYVPCDCPPPFRDEMLWLYQKRLEEGKNTPNGKAYKLVYNSAYGKMAQSIGMPKYANPLYASLITSHCRSMILNAIATHPRRTADLLMVATDGVYFRTPHPGLDIDPQRLGAWDHSVKDNLTLFMPGVYWDDTTRIRLDNGESPKLKSRGVSARDLARCIEDIDRQFMDWNPALEWPSAVIPVDFSMTTAIQALARGKWDTAGTVSSDTVKTISASPRAKRAGIPRLIDGAWTTYPYSRGHTLATTPYDKAFGLPPVEEGLTPEGMTITEVLREGLL